MTIRLVCVRCGREMSEHAGNWVREAKTYRCPDGGLMDGGAMLIDSHALDDIPPARRALERARLAQMRHDERVDVQLGLEVSRDGASDE